LDLRQSHLRHYRFIARMGAADELFKELNAVVRLTLGEVKFSKPELLDEVCVRFPDLRVIMAHFGWPWPDVTVALALRHTNVFIDVSGWKPRYLPQSILAYQNGILHDRFMFGTDYPMLRQKEWIDDFEENLRPKLRPGVAEKLLGGNARRVIDV